MRLALLWLSTYSRDLAILLLAAAIGYPVVKRVVDGAVRLPLAILTGLGGLSLVVALFSWLHIFGTGAMVGVAIAVAAISLTRLIRGRRDQRYHRPQLWPPRLTQAPYLAIGAVVGLVSVLALYPPSTATAFDPTMYHLPLARDLVTHHGFTYDPFVRYPFFPQANEALFAVAFLLSPNPVLSQGLQFCIGALCIWLVLAYFRDTGRSVSGGVAASVVILASPLVIGTMITAVIDIWPMAFLLAGAVLAAFNLQGRTARSPLRWAVVGFLLGQAAASKYTGLADAVVLGLVLAVALVRWPVGTRQIALVAIGAAGFLVVVTPWYARTFTLTGDPTYPFLTSVFGNQRGPWTARELTGQEQSVRGTSAPGVLGIVGRDVSYALGEVSNGGDSGVPGGIPPLTVLLGTGFLGLAVRSLRQDRVYRILIVSAAGMLLVWVLTSADQRYVTGAIGLLALAAGMTVDGILRSSVRFPTRRIAAVPAVAIAVVALYPSVRFVQVTLEYFGLPPASAQDKSSFLDSAGLGCLPGIQYLNRRFGSHYSAYGVHCEETTFYAEGRYMGDWFGPAGYFRVLGPTGSVSSIPRLADNLVALKSQFLIADSSDSAIPSPQSLVASGRFRTVFNRDDTLVFRVEG